MTGVWATQSGLMVATGVLAAGTYALRVTGPLVLGRFALGAGTRQLLGTAAVVLLTALVVNATLLQGHTWAGWSRPAGVVVGGALAWRRFSLVTVVVAAAATTAGLRLLGANAG